MVFPFSIRYSKRLKATITANNQQVVLQYIQNNLKKGKADNIVIEDSQIKYKGSTSLRRGSLYRSVDSGVFTLNSKNGQWFLSYQINMRTLFIATAIMSTTLGVLQQIGGGSWWVAIYAFLWLCGANWVISCIRHGNVVARIGSGIDELLCDKEEEIQMERKEDTERLKSWF